MKSRAPRWFIPGAVVTGVLICTRLNQLDVTEAFPGVPMMLAGRSPSHRCYDDARERPRRKLEQSDDLHCFAPLCFVLSM